MKIIIPEHLVNEIINKDLSYIEGDQKNPETEVTVGAIKKDGAQMTTDDFARQAAQYTPAYYAGRYIREDEQVSNGEIANLDILDALDQRGLKQIVGNLEGSFNALPPENKNEGVAIALKHILSSINWQDIEDNYKNELRQLIG